MSESLPVKQKIFESFTSELKPEVILATNTSSISITKIAASAIPLGVSAASEEGRTIASRVVGESFRLKQFSQLMYPRFTFFQSRSGHGMFVADLDIGALNSF